MSLRVLALFVALAGTAGCRLFQPPGPSAVAQGHYFATGNPSYDEFFVRLYHMQVELKTAPETLAAVRRDAARGLELPPTANDAELKEALRVKTTELRGRGTSLSIEHAGEPGAPARLSVSGTPAAADQPLVKLLGDALVRLGEVRAHVAPWQKELEWLPPNGIALDGSVEAAFIGESRATRDDVRENLADGQRVVALMSARLKELDASAATLEGVFTGAIGETKSEPAPAPSPPSPPRPRPRAAPSPAPAPSKPAPAPAAAGGDEPASPPKPKQGTAKPDFEP